MKPLISVIIPAYNDASTLEMAVDSICAQTYTNLEIIIIDDKSTDDTRNVAQAYASKDKRVKYFQVQENDPYRVNRIGVNINAGYSARNLGVEKARGDIITFQDADDVSYANRIEVQFDLLEKYNAMHAVVDYGHLEGSGEQYIGKTLPVNLDTVEVLGFKDITKLVKENKPIPQWLRDPSSYRPVNTLPVRLLKRLGRKLFWRDIAPYPCSGNTAMVRREVFNEIRFRPLWERTRPSRKGRGADMDFNYAVAERFGKSVAIKASLYLWYTS